MRIGARYEGWNWCFECKRTIEATHDAVLEDFGFVVCMSCSTRFKVANSSDPKRSRYVLEARHEDH